MNQCDNCFKKTEEELYTIKWPALDAHMQYQEVCKDCAEAYANFRKNRHDRTIFERMNKYYERAE